MVAFGKPTRVRSQSNLNRCSMNGVGCKGSTRVEPCIPLQLEVFPSAYESRGGLTDSGLLLPDSLVITHESEEDEIFGGDHKPNQGSYHSLYCVPLLSNQT